MIDLNGNGIPDYQEPGVWRFFGNIIASIVKTFAAPHTVAYRVADVWQHNIEGGQ